MDYDFNKGFDWEVTVEETIMKEMTNWLGKLSFDLYLKTNWNSVYRPTSTPTRCTHFNLRVSQIYVSSGWRD